MFGNEQMQNSVLTWFLRVLGWLLMFIGFTMLTQLINTLGELHNHVLVILFSDTFSNPETDIRYPHNTLEGGREAGLGVLYKATDFVAPKLYALEIKSCIFILFVYYLVSYLMS